MHISEVCLVPKLWYFGYLIKLPGFYTIAKKEIRMILLFSIFYESSFGGREHSQLSFHVCLKGTTSFQGKLIRARKKFHTIY